MKVNPKPCKGNYRVEHFKGCDEEVIIRKYGLCQSCYRDWLLAGSELANKQIKKLSLHAKKTVKSEERLKRQKQREELKTLADWKNDLQKEINWIVKQIDKDSPCISHPGMAGFLRWDAGHYYTVKSHSDIRFNLHNIHKQNSQANERYGGCPEYLIGLRKRYDYDYAEMVLNLPLKYKGIGKRLYTISNIKNIYLPNSRLIKRGIKVGIVLTRDEINKTIGMYQ